MNVKTLSKKTSGITPEIKNNITRFTYYYIVKSRFNNNPNLIQQLFQYPNRGKGLLVQTKFAKKKETYLITFVKFEVYIYNN